MKRILSILFFIAFLSNYQETQAQYCAMILCEDYEDNSRGLTNLLGIFGGFTTNALGDDVEILVYTRLQNYPLNEAHIHRLQIIDPYGNLIIESSPVAFILEKPTETHSIRSGLTFNLEYSGTYTLHCYVDGILQSELFFYVE